MRFAKIRDSLDALKEALERYEQRFRDRSSAARYFLDGKEVFDVVRATEDMLEVAERHWESGEIVREPDGSPRTMILRGQVRVEAETANEWEPHPAMRLPDGTVVLVNASMALWDDEA